MLELVNRVKSSAWCIAVLMLLCSHAFAAGSQTAEENAQFDSYFPNSTDGGEKLKTMLAAEDQSAYTDSAVLDIVRNGLRNAGDYTTQAIQQISTRLIENKDPSPLRDKAVELMYNASFSPDGLVRYYAVYYGLSLVQPKSQQVLDRLTALTVRGENAGRIISGVLFSNQQQQFIKCLESYLTSTDTETAERAKAILEQLNRQISYMAAARGGGGGKAATPQKNEPNNYEETFKELYEYLGGNYPCFELKGIDWQAVGDELLPRSKKLDTREQFGLLCIELVARLEDNHAVLLNGSARVPAPPLPQWDPGFTCLENDQARPAVYSIDPGSPAEQAGVKIGMVVLTIDDQDVSNAIDATMKTYSRYFGYSSKRRLTYDTYRSFHRRMERDTEIKFKMLDTEGKEHEFTLKASLGSRYLPRLPVPIEGIRDSANVAWKMLEDNIGYTYVRRIRPNLPKMLDQAVGALKDARGLIVDVRGNSGGGFDGAEAFVNFYIDDDTTEPNRPRYKGPMALLIDNRCVSAGEGWASWFIANKRARFFGQSTTGASSRKIEYELTNKLYKVQLPVKPYKGFLDRIIERRGLEPNVPVTQTAADLAAGHDTVLETARDYLLAFPDDPNSAGPVNKPDNH